MVSYVLSKSLLSCVSGGCDGFKGFGLGLPGLHVLMTKAVPSRIWCATKI